MASPRATDTAAVSTASDTIASAKKAADELFQHERRLKIACRRQKQKLRRDRLAMYRSTTWEGYLTLADLARRPVAHHELWTLWIILAAGVVGAAVFLAVPLGVRSPILHMLVAGIMGGFAGSALVASLLYFPSQDRIAKFRQDAGCMIESITPQLAKSHARLKQIYSRLKRTRAELRARKRELAARRIAARSLERSLREQADRLLKVHWRVMRGDEFQEFVALVCRALGGVVQRTPVGDDRGIDLIVDFAGRKTAVQAKGYVGVVGDTSVRQAHDGMKQWACGACAVITNRNFSPQAVELAARLGCTLIDADRMHDFAAGRIPLQANRKGSLS